MSPSRRRTATSSDLAAPARSAPISACRRCPTIPRRTSCAITGLASSPFILAASKSFKGNSLQDVIAAGKAGQKLSIGHGGNGTLMHLTAEMLLQDAQASKAPLVAYRGIAPVVNDLMGDHVDARHRRSAVGQGGARRRQAIKAIAVTSNARFYLVAGYLPTFAESGLPGFEFDRLVRHRRAARHPARRRRQAQRGLRRRAEGSGNGEAHSRAWARSRCR